MLLVILIIFMICFVVERVIPGWQLPSVKTWPLRVVMVNLLQLGVVLIAGVTWECWLSSWSLFHFPSNISPVIGGFTAYFFCNIYILLGHRWRHEYDLLWIGFHQIHHSPQRLEVITSFYKHPGEMIVNSIIGSLLVYTLLGLSIEAGAFYTFFTAIGEFFYHTNIKTPHWIGYIFQRPEMHRIHHQYNRHKNNYGDIVWWDMLFGTYENPREWKHKCGFTPQREERLIEMLMYKDVHKNQLMEMK